jgi:hypothetical protein
MADALTVAISYIRRGWAPIPVPFRQKGPVFSGWPALRLNEQTAPQYFNGGPLNIGIILGLASQNLTDLDLDCVEAIVLAPVLLPPTIRFGRTTARDSHWVYRSAFPVGVKAVVPFDDPIKLRSDPTSARLVEIRSGANGGGCQTVFPGSVHMSGEPIDWAPNGEHDPPTEIDGTVLSIAAARLAAAALIARYWPPQGNRHDLSLALGGALARAGWDLLAIETFVGAIVRVANDPRPTDRVRCDAP